MTGNRRELPPSSVAGHRPGPVQGGLIEGLLTQPLAPPGAPRPKLDRAADSAQVPDDPLTSREREVFKLIAEAHTSEQIAELLVISPRTVERHRENILSKLGLSDRVEVTRYAIRHGLVEP